MMYHYYCSAAAAVTTRLFLEPLHQRGGYKKVQLFKSALKSFQKRTRTKRNLKPRPRSKGNKGSTTNRDPVGNTNSDGTNPPFHFMPLFTSFILFERYIAANI